MFDASSPQTLVEWDWLVAQTVDRGQHGDRRSAVRTTAPARLAVHRVRSHSCGARGRRIRVDDDASSEKRSIASFFSGFGRGFSSRRVPDSSPAAVRAALLDVRLPI